jgi:hypothetical protein
MTIHTNGHEAPTSKQKQLRDLNKETCNLQTALNQTQVCLNRAMRLLEQTYQKKRSAIINDQDTSL